MANTANVRLDGSRRPTGARVSRILTMVLLSTYVAQCAWFIGTQSLAFDEPMHISAGLDVWRHGRFEPQFMGHPPLARLLCTLPLLVKPDWQVVLAGPTEPMPPTYMGPGRRPTLVSPKPVTIALCTRPVAVCFGLMLGGLLWLTARSMFSEGAANLALALYVFSPALIAHFSLVGTDGAGVLFIFATAVQIIRWRRNPSRTETLILGGVLGLLLLSKFNAPPIFVLALGWALVLKPTKIATNPAEWNWGKTLAAAAFAFLILWAGYRFHVTRVTFHEGQRIIKIPGREPLVKSVKTRVNLTFFLPASEYLEGFLYVAHDYQHVQYTFFLGRVSGGGSKLYFPVVILLKWPTVVLVLFLSALVITLRGRFLVPGALRIMASFPAIFSALALFAHFNKGDRYILPLYPFVLLFTAGIWDVAKRSRAGIGIVLAAVLLNAADCLRYAPDYLSYFTPAINSKQTYRLLTDSNLDWGQGLLDLRQYQKEHPNDTIHLAYFGRIDPAMYGIRAVPLAPGERVFGTVIVSATNLSGQFLTDPKAYRWVLHYPCKLILNHSMFVFEVPSTLPTAAVRGTYVHQGQLNWMRLSLLAAGLVIILRDKILHNRPEL